MPTSANNHPVSYKALAWTICTHVLLILLLLLLHFTLPASPQPAPENGLEVNLGTSDNGSGADQPMDMEEPAAAASHARSSNASVSAPQPDIESNDDKDAPEVNTPANKQQQQAGRSEQQATDNRQRIQQPQRPKYTYAGATGRGGNGATTNAPGTNEGNTTGPGDRGVPHGTPGAPNYSGAPGIGTGGISHSLAGRNIVAFPPKEAEFREGGKVVIRVTVNRDGAIVNQNVLSATSAELRPIALRKLMQVKFNRSDDAPQEQFGTITFVFKTRS